MFLFVHYGPFDSSKWTSTTLSDELNLKVNKVGDTITGELTTDDLAIKGNELKLIPTNSSSNNSADIVFKYGNDQEKCRIWTADNPTTADDARLQFRSYKSDGTVLQSMTHLLSEVDGVLKSGDTMTGQLKTSTYSSVAMGSYGSSQNTIPNFCNEIRKSSGATGSVNIDTAFTKNNVTIATGWYNFIYSPHRSGGKNGNEDGDNTNYGTLILNMMNSSWDNAATYILRISNSATDNYVSHVRKIIDSHLFKSGTYVANFSSNTTHVTFANMGVSSRPSTVICTVQSLSNAFICYDFDASSTDITLHIQNNTNTSISGNVRFGYIVCP